MRATSELYFRKKVHQDLVFRDKFYERFYIWNDDCDGKIWEKEHLGAALIGITSYYPGSYMSTSYHAVKVYPRGSDDGKAYVSNSIDNTCGNSNGKLFFRTKNFVVVANTKTVAGSSQKYNSYRVSRDGIHWTPWQGNIPSPWANAGGWSTKNNEGLINGVDDKGVNAYWKLTIDFSTGLISREKFANINPQGEIPIIDSSTYIGDTVTQGTQTVTDPETLKQTTFYKFMSLQYGPRPYISQIPTTYEYTDYHESDPVRRIKTASYNWSFSYWAGIYLAASMKTDVIYYNEVTGQWVTKRNFIILESTDGFKSFNKHEYEDVPPYEFQEWTTWYYNDSPVIIERGRTGPEQDAQTYWGFRYLDFSFMLSITSDSIAKIQMPFKGMKLDGSFDALDLLFFGSEQQGNRLAVRGIGTGFKNVVYIGIDDRPSDPQGPLLIPTAFRYNGWSSSSYDVGGFIYIDPGEGGSISHPKEAFAFCADNPMIDSVNATSGEDYHHVFYISDNTKYQYELREEMNYYARYYRVNNFSREQHSVYLKYHLNKIIKPIVILSGSTRELNKFRRALRHVKTMFDFRWHKFNQDSPYYNPQGSRVTKINNNAFNFVDTNNLDYTYCFAVYYRVRGNGSVWPRTCPLVISANEFTTLYSPSGNNYKNVRTLEYCGFTWYYMLAGAIETNDTNAERYIDMTRLGVSPSADQIALECLKEVHPEEYSADSGYYPFPIPPEIPYL